LRAEDLGVDDRVVASGIGFNAPTGSPPRRYDRRRRKVVRNIVERTSIKGLD
jgi:hypothetical protein